MATKTLYLNNDGGAPVYSETAPTSVKYICLYQPSTFYPNGNFFMMDTTAYPSNVVPTYTYELPLQHSLVAAVYPKNAIRTDYPFTGTFEGGNWYISNDFEVITHGGPEGTIALTLRLYKSKNSDGSNATEITNNVVYGTTILPGTISSMTVNFGAIYLDNEYLYFQYDAKQITGGDEEYRHWASSITLNSYLTTTDFVAGKPVTPKIVSILDDDIIV